MHLIAILLGAAGRFHADIGAFFGEIRIVRHQSAPIDLFLLCVGYLSCRDTVAGQEQTITALQQGRQQVMLDIIVRIDEGTVDIDTELRLFSDYEIP